MTQVGILLMGCGLDVTVVRMLRPAPLLRFVREGVCGSATAENPYTARCR